MLWQYLKEYGIMNVNDWKRYGLIQKYFYFLFGY